MERDLLESYLDQGLSLERIAVLEDRDPSTVAYWAKKYGLTPHGRRKHAPVGGLSREQLEELVEGGCSQREIATALGVSQATVRHWLEKFGLRTSRRGRRLNSETTRVRRHCPVHGMTQFYARHDGGDRCIECNKAAVSERRREVKRILVAEAGGACMICGYSKSIWALHFHHLDPDEKSFALSGRGLCRPLEELRKEVAKCVLLCSNCHGEVEEGLTPVPER